MLTSIINTLEVEKILLNEAWLSGRRRLFG